MRITQTPLAPTLDDWQQILADLSLERKLWHFKRGDFIQMNPEEVWVVHEGVVQLNTLYDGGEIGVLGLAYPHLPFGVRLTQIAPYEAIALSEVELLRLHSAEIEQSPRLASNVFKALSYRLRQTESLLAIAGCRRIKERLKYLILLLKQELGEVDAEGDSFPIRLTHRQLASMVGSTRVTVTRLLRELRDEGIFI